LNFVRGFLGILVLICLNLPVGVFAQNASNSDKGVAQENISDSPTSNKADLDFESVGGTEIRVEAKKENSTSKFWPWLAVVVLSSGIFLIYFQCRKVAAGSTGIELSSFPVSAKIALSFVLLGFGVTHLLAAVTVYLDTRVVYSSAEEYFFYIKPARLTALSHAHLMAISMMDAITASLFTLGHAGRNQGFSSAVVTMTFLGIFGDIASWWLIKYFGENFELLSMFTGIFFSSGFAIMAMFVFWGLWFAKAFSRKAKI